MAGTTDLRDSHYQVLGVEAEATRAEIRESYRRLARKWHPDVVPGELRAEAEEVMKRVNAAYAILGDTTLRARYDVQVRFDPDEARRIAQEHARAQAEAVHRSQAWQQVFDEYRQQEPPPGSWRPPSPGFLRAGLMITIVTARDRSVALRARWEQAARDAGLTLNVVSESRRLRSRHRTRLWLEGDTRQMRRFLRWLDELVEAEPGPWYRRPRVSYLRTIR